MRKLKRKNKKAWIKIVESFIAILMIVSVLSIIVMKDLVRRPDASEIVYEEEFHILQKIQVNSSLRQDIIELNPIPMESTNPSFPFDLEIILNSTSLVNLNCSLKVCIPGSGCVLSDPISEKEIYAKSIIISSDRNTYNPRELAIFCWKD